MKSKFCFFVGLFLFSFLIVSCSKEKEEKLPVAVDCDLPIPPNLQVLQGKNGILMFRWPGSLIPTVEIAYVNIKKGNNPELGNKVILTGERDQSINGFVTTRKISDLKIEKGEVYHFYLWDQFRDQKSRWYLGTTIPIKDV